MLNPDIDQHAPGQKTTKPVGWQNIWVRVQLTMLFIVILKFTCGAAYKDATTDTSLRPVDFFSYYAAAERLNSGQPLYLLKIDENGGAPYRYTPLLAQCIRPLALRLPFVSASKIWALTNIGFLLLGMIIFFKAINLRRKSYMAAALTVIFTGFRFWPTVIELAIGNTDMILFAIFSCMFLCVKRDRWILLALLIAMAAAIKTWSILLVGFLLLSKQFRAFFASIAFFCASLVILFASVGFGEFNNFILLTTRTFLLFTGGVHEYAKVVEAASPHALLPMSHSIIGITQLYFTRNSFGVDPLIANQWIYLMLLSSLLLLVAGGLFMAAKLKGNDVWRSQLLLSLCILSMLLTVPVIHIYCMVLTLPSLWILLITGEQRLTRASVGSFICAVLCYFVLSLPSRLSPIPPEFCHQPNALRLAIPFLAIFTLWGLTLNRLLRLKLST